MNLFPGSVVDGSDDLVVVDVPELGRRVQAFSPAAPAAGAEVTIAIRPEKFSLRRDAAVAAEGLPVNGAPVIVEDFAYLGTHTTWHVRLDGGKRVTVTSPTERADVALRSGERAHLAWQVRDSVVLTA